MRLTLCFFTTTPTSDQRVRSFKNKHHSQAFFFSNTTTLLCNTFITSQLSFSCNRTWLDLEIQAPWSGLEKDNVLG